MDSFKTPVSVSHFHSIASTTAVPPSPDGPVRCSDRGVAGCGAAMEGRQKVVAQLRQLHNDLQDGLRQICWDLASGWFRILVGILDLLGGLGCGLLIGRVFGRVLRRLAADAGVFWRNRLGLYSAGIEVMFHFTGRFGMIGATK